LFFVLDSENNSAEVHLLHRSAASFWAGKLLDAERQENGRAGWMYDVHK
jgi:hypothetical protein